MAGRVGLRKANFTVNKSAIPSRWIVGALVVAALYVGLQWFSFQGILRAGNDLFWDTDSYARMYRVGSIVEGGNGIIRFQNVDGFPSGHEPHWTLPFDLWCVTLAKVTSLTTAGHVASPIIGLCCALGFAFWCHLRLPRLIAGGVTLIYLFQPAFHWATAFGRPDHQSLVHACFLLAVILDIGFWMKAFEPTPDRLNRWRVLLNGLALGVGIWTTIEMAPLWAVQVVSAAVIALVTRARGGWRALGQRALGWLVTLFVLLVAFGLECRFDVSQIRLGNFGDEMLRRWFSVVQEFQPLMMVRGEWRWYGLHGLFGLSFYLLPILIWFFVRARSVNRAVKISLGLALTLYVVMVFAQIHWSSPVSVLWPVFASVAVHSMCGSKRMPSLLQSGAGYALVLAIVFFPCALGFIDFAKRVEYGASIRPVCEWIRKNTPSNADMERFSMRTPFEGWSVMTQWWQGSHVQYLARRPVVASPYHTNIGSIEDAYRFLVASSWAEAEEILARRRCRYVLVEDHRLFVDDAQRVLQDGREWVEIRTRKLPDGTRRRGVKFLPLFYETMFYRLQVLNGGGLPFKLVYESRERSPYDANQARFKVFEYLP